MLDYANLSGMSEDLAKRFFPTLLPAQERRIYESVANHHQPFLANMKAFQAAMSSSSRLNVQRSKLSQCRQRGRTVAEYAKELRRIGEDAHPAVHVDRIPTVLTAFINGLDKALREQVLRAEPSTLTHAIDLALKEEAIQSVDPDDRISSLETTSAISETGRSSVSPTGRSQHSAASRSRNSPAGCFCHSPAGCSGHSAAGYTSDSPAVRVYHSTASDSRRSPVGSSRRSPDGYSSNSPTGCSSYSPTSCPSDPTIGCSIYSAAGDYSDWPVSSNGGRASPHRPPGSSNGEPASPHRPPVSSNGEPASPHRPPGSSHGEPASPHRPPVSSNGEPASPHRPPGSSNGEPASPHRPPVSSNGELASPHLYPGPVPRHHLFVHIGRGGPGRAAGGGRCGTSDKEQDTTGRREIAVDWEAEDIIPEPGGQEKSGPPEPT